MLMLKVTILITLVEKIGSKIFYISSSSNIFHENIEVNINHQSPGEIGNNVTKWHQKVIKININILSGNTFLPSEII